MLNKAITKNVTTHLTIIIALTLYSGLSQAETCYVWTSAEGVKHFGSIPPSNVQAKTVACNNKVPKNTVRKNSEADTAAAQEAAKKTRENHCKQEKQRLQTIRAAGSNVRMTQADGSVKILTAAEIAEEVRISEEFINKNCL